MRLRTWSGWPTAVAAVIAVGVLLALIALNHGSELPLFVVQLDLLVLVAGAAYLLDDVAKSVTDVVPISLLRRRGVIVLQGLLVVATGWLIMVWLCGWLTPTEPLTFLSWEIAGVSCMAIAMASVVSLCGEDEPGNLVAPVLALVFIAALIVQRMMDVTLLATSTEDPANGGWWALICLLAALAIVLSSHRVRRPKGRSEVVTEGSKKRVTLRQ